jgi:hypothetical protein
MRTSLLLGFEFCDFEGLSQIVEVMIFNKLVFSMHTNQIKLFNKGKSLMWFYQLQYGWMIIEFAPSIDVLILFSHVQSKKENKSCYSWEGKAKF